jgi:hypothetical protein
MLKRPGQAALVGGVEQPQVTRQEGVLRRQIKLPATALAESTARAQQQHASERHGADAT